MRLRPDLWTLLGIRGRMLLAVHRPTMLLVSTSSRDRTIADRSRIQVIAVGSRLSRDVRRMMHDAGCPLPVDR